MDPFLIFCLFTIITCPLIGIWARHKGKSPFEYAFLAFLFTPLLPAVILLLADTGDKVKGG